MAACPCGSEASLSACCGRFVFAGAWPTTPEELMRARYTAYARRELDFLSASQAPESRASLDRAGMQRWAERCHWEQLRVVRVVDGMPGDAEGFVEFRARYLEDGRVCEHHELSRFRRHRGRWYYCEGSTPQAAQIGRNDPCGCGSGRKAKRCCGG